MSAVIHSSASTAYERHPPGDLAIWIFILAELGVFALFFAAYAFARSHNVALFDEFQQHLNRRAALVNTLALITSSYFVVRAVAAIREGNRSHCVRWLLAALGLRACIWVWLVMLLLTGHPVAGYPGRADQHCLHHVVLTGMAPAWGGYPLQSTYWPRNPRKNTEFSSSVSMSSVDSVASYQDQAQGNCHWY